MLRQLLPSFCSDLVLFSSLLSHFQKYFRCGELGCGIRGPGAHMQVETNEGGVRSAGKSSCLSEHFAGMCTMPSLLWLGRLSGAPADPHAGELPPAGTALQPHSKEIAELGRLVGFCLLIRTGYQLIAE